VARVALNHGSSLCPSPSSLLLRSPRPSAFGRRNPCGSIRAAGVADYAIAFQTYGAQPKRAPTRFLSATALTGDQLPGRTAPDLPTSQAGGARSSARARCSDTRALFHHSTNVIGGCMGSTGPSGPQSRHRQAWGPLVPGHYHSPTCAPAPGQGHRSFEDRSLVLVPRRLDGRHAGAAMGGVVSRARLPAAAPIASAARHSAQNIGPFHEVGRQAIMADPGLVRWPITWIRQKAGRASPFARHGGPYHLSVGAGAASENSAATCRIAAP